MLQLDLETRVEPHQDDEPLSITPLEEYDLRQRLFDAVRAGGPLPEAPPDVIHAQGILPPPPLDAAPYARAASELNALLPVWERLRSADEREVLPVDIRLASGLRLTGRLGDVRPDGLCRVEARKIGAGQLLPHWIDMLALAASTGHGAITCGALDGAGGVALRIGSIGADEALRRLQTLADLYAEGQRRPLCFLPNLALEFVDLVAGEKPCEPDEALAKCNGSLANDFTPRWEAKDVWFKRLLGPAPHVLGDRAETSEFCRLAVDVVEPMARTLEAADTAQWLDRPPRTP